MAVMIDRRHFIGGCCAVAGALLAGCKEHGASKRCPGGRSDFAKIDWVTSVKDVRQIGPQGGPPVVVLHELPGLTDDDLALARCLSKEQFHVYVPTLFGQFGQDNVLRGLKQACLGSTPLFACSELSARSAVLDMLEPLCDEIARHEGRPIGVVGMCLTGMLPLALLPNQVTAAVLCQPTLPFDFSQRKPSGQQVTNLGLGAADLTEACESSVPFMVMHYAGDELCPVERIQALNDTFGARVATVQLSGDHHSSLAGDFHEQAFADAVAYLKVRLGARTGPTVMQVARLGGRRCEIAYDGTWRAL
ncbi:hypothetical protein TBR22_A05750 [Luteitalea sp. TBR-22]|uniref:alpha/beta hydrolase n=1 Tax=Luteitalea sp. TBR-22 TaxID=2802971 RepID=UPI001AFC43E2|nr:dienelactone hydrolase family protein [Luteitalea sp. TBR-22]BCS31375.1 hypothetical protein TBR22_A05750 [Luteitalea sp. TBR-22]